jgi:hypothetical protein
VIKGNIKAVFEAVSGPFYAKNYCYLGDFEAAEATRRGLSTVPVYWAEFPQKIWVNYGIGWSEASDTNLLLVGAERSE